MTEFIGSKVKQLRKSQKMTQEHLAYLVGITRSTISNYESGRRSPHLRELSRIAAVFNVGLEYFGISAKDEALELLARAKDVFESEDVPDETKEELYREFMKLYLKMKG